MSVSPKPTAGRVSGENLMTERGYYRFTVKHPATSAARMAASLRSTRSAVDKCALPLTCRDHTTAAARGTGLVRVLNDFGHERGYAQRSPAFRRPIGSCWRQTHWAGDRASVTGPGWLAPPGLS